MWRDISSSLSLCLARSRCGRSFASLELASKPERINQEGSLLDSFEHHCRYSESNSSASKFHARMKTSGVLYFRPWLMRTSFHHWSIFSNMVIIRHARKQHGQWPMLRRVDHHNRLSEDRAFLFSSASNNASLLCSSKICHRSRSNSSPVWIVECDRYKDHSGCIQRSGKHSQVRGLGSETNHWTESICYHDRRMLRYVEGKREIVSTTAFVRFSSRFGQNRIFAEPRKHWSLPKSLSHHWDLFRCWRRW